MLKDVLDGKMQKVKMMNVAFMGFRLNENGFTLISSLLRILIISLTLPILVFTFSKLDTHSVEESLSIEQLFFIIQNEVYGASAVSHTDNQLMLHVGRDVISFDRYGGLIRRQVNKNGHEIYQRDVNDFKVNAVTGGVMLTIRTLKGEIYERIIITNG